MTKYIELLRKHQESAPSKTAEPSEAHDMIEVSSTGQSESLMWSAMSDASAYNPYSQPSQAGPEVDEINHDLTYLLEDEPAPEAKAAKCATPESELLIAEDEAEPVVIAPVVVEPSSAELAHALTLQASYKPPGVEDDTVCLMDGVKVPEAIQPVVKPLPEPVVVDPLDLMAVEEDDDDVSPAPDPFCQVEVEQPIEKVAVVAAFQIPAWLQGIGQDTLSVFQAAQQQVPTDLSTISEDLRLLLNHLESTPAALDALELEINRTIKDIRKLDESVGDLVQKSIMMMLYAIKTGQQLKLQQQELLHHIIAAMVHHIGMSMVPDAIRHKKERLKRDEIKRIKEAPDDGLNYLKTCHIEDENILLAASQAVERYDGSGGTGLKGLEIAWSARLIGLLSMFEALIHFRPYRQRLLPRDAIRELVNHHKKAFDPVMLKALIESISLYPVGTFVQINTGEIGQVIAVHSKFPLRPLIHINMDRHANPINAREINLKAQPNLMIQKCMYEEALQEIRQAHAH